jgi:DNA-directed RNA polymerase specialized sigma24 family protein
MFSRSSIGTFNLNPRSLEDDIAAAVAGDPSHAGGAEGEDRMTARARAALLAGLSETQRTAVTLHYLEDRPVLSERHLMSLSAKETISMLR